MYSFIIAISILLVSGKERWDVKTLTDGFTPHAIVHSTIHAERLHAAPKWAERLSRQPAEDTEVIISGEIVGIGLEADGDYHLDFSDGKETMVCEIPEPKQNPEYANVWKALREHVAEAVGFTPNKFKMLKKPIPYTITGMRFYDRPAHGKGGSPNGCEIHPCLSISL